MLPKRAAIPRNKDYNNGNQEGFGYFQVTIKNGKRWSTARAFLDPARSRPNLRIETEALTDKVLLEGKRAVGVAYTVHGQKREARAGREVIVSCGAVMSPGVLEHSGIGQPELLRKHGIEVKHELKGVGENYGDHFAPRVKYRINQRISLNEQTRGLQLLKAIAQYYTTRSGVLTYNAGMVCGFVRTRPGLETPDMQLHVLPASYEVGTKRMLENEPGMTVIVGQCRPDSRGSIHIKSGVPGSEPAIRPNFLSAQTDRDAAVAGMQIGRGSCSSRQSPGTSPSRPGRARKCRATTSGSTTPGTPAPRLSTSSAPARWAATRWPWLTTACACTASRGSG